MFVERAFNFCNIFYIRFVDCGKSLDTVMLLCNLDYVDYKFINYSTSMIFFNHI